jgi:nucleoside-diphosphate-sugar epimerase
MRLLVLGGTRFVGRAVVADALARGWEVTAVHRGVTGVLPAGVTRLLTDRTSEPDLSAALGSGSWDLVVDTWSGAPAVVGLAAKLLTDRAERYGYVSSASVYRWGEHVDERSPVVDGDPKASDGEYPALKRGAELAVLENFPDALLCRAGLILGPHEDIGRLRWWLNRIARGGHVLAPGRPERPLQYVDARDLAAWLLSGLDSALSGAVDVISRSGHATTAQLLESCIAATGSETELVWITEAELNGTGVEPWLQLPCWVPESGESARFLEADTSLAAATGLRCRPIRETVEDTWRSLLREGAPAQRSDRDLYGLPAEIEDQILRDHRMRARRSVARVAAPGRDGSS